MSAEHLQRMQEGRERQLAEDRKAQVARQVAYSAWVREDARLYRALLAARDAGTGEAEAYVAWRANSMPVLP